MTKQVGYSRPETEATGQGSHVVRRSLFLGFGAGVGIDFRAERDFDNFWGLPGHLDPP
jgi:hypothetical protein